MPLDTFARETVEAICGQANPTLRGPDTAADGPPRQYSAAELSFSWLVEPSKWENVDFLPAADEQFRRNLDLPLEDANHRRLRCVSPRVVESSDAIAVRWADLMRRTEAGARTCE